MLDHGLGDLDEVASFEHCGAVAARTDELALGDRHQGGPVTERHQVPPFDDAHELVAGERRSMAPFDEADPRRVVDLGECLTEVERGTQRREHQRVHGDRHRARGRARERLVGRQAHERDPIALVHRRRERFVLGVGALRVGEETLDLGVGRPDGPDHPIGRRRFRQLAHRSSRSFLRCPGGEPGVPQLGALARPPGERQGPPDEARATVRGDLSRHGTSIDVSNGPGGSGGNTPMRVPVLRWRWSIAVGAPGALRGEEQPVAPVEQRPRVVGNAAGEQFLRDQEAEPGRPCEAGIE